jgi:hypothetical protein
LKVKDIMHLPPETELVLYSADRSGYAITSWQEDEGVYSVGNDEYLLLSEHGSDYLEEHHMQDNDELAFVSVLVLQA